MSVLELDLGVGDCDSHGIDWRPCALGTANGLLAAHHYLGPIRQGRHVFGGFDASGLVAVQVWKAPTARNLPADGTWLWKWDVWWSDEPTRSPDGMGHGIGGWARTRLGARRACVEVMERGVDREPGIRLLDEDDWNRNPVELRVEPGVLYVPDGMRFEDEEGDGLPAHDPEIWPAAFEHLTRAHPERWSDDDGSDS